MYCPFCGANDTKVVDSRLANDGEKVRRRRACLKCEERFTTYETAELSMPRIVKSDETREPFIEQKLRDGIHRALEKRPVSTEDIETAITRIKRKLLGFGEREISSRKIGELVMQALKRLDHVAYVRFASVYLSFEDINAFKDVIGHLESEPDELEPIAPLSNELN